MVIKLYTRFLGLDVSIRWLIIGVILAGFIIASNSIYQEVSYAWPQVSSPSHISEPTSFHLTFAYCENGQIFRHQTGINECWDQGGLKYLFDN